MLVLCYMVQGEVGVEMVVEGSESEGRACCALRALRRNVRKRELKGLS